MSRLVMLVAVVCLAAASSGCAREEGEQRGIGTMTEYDAALSARNVLDDESLDPDSLVHDKVLLVGPALREQQADGTWWWRVSLLTIKEKPAGICIWVQSSLSAGRETTIYDLDRCDPRPDL